MSTLKKQNQSLTKSWALQALSSLFFSGGFSPEQLPAT